MLTISGYASSMLQLEIFLIKDAKYLEATTAT
jgi:hypothetical protein